MTIVDRLINKILTISILPTTISWNNSVKFKKGTNDKSGDELTPAIKAIIPGKKHINVNGVKAL